MNLCDITVSPDGLAPPIANAGRDVVVQPGETVTLNGIESLPLDDVHITRYDWSLQSGDASVTMEVKTDTKLYVIIVQAEQVCVQVRVM